MAGDTPYAAVFDGRVVQVNIGVEIRRRLRQRVRLGIRVGRVLVPQDRDHGTRRLADIGIIERQERFAIALTDGREQFRLHGDGAEDVVPVPHHLAAIVGLPTVDIFIDVGVALPGNSCGSDIVRRSS